MENTLTLLPLHINNEWVMIDSIFPYPTGDVVVSVTKIEYPYSYISYPVNGFSAKVLSGYGPFPIIESDKFGNIVTYLLNFGNLYDKKLFTNGTPGKEINGLFSHTSGMKVTSVMKYMIPR